MMHVEAMIKLIRMHLSTMRGTGMTHVEAIIMLIRMHLSNMRVPALKPYFHKFAQDLELFEAVEADIRPYHRLLVPQAKYLFISSELRPLIAVAGSFIKEVGKGLWEPFLQQGHLSETCLQGPCGTLRDTSPLKPAYGTCAAPWNGGGKMSLFLRRTVL